MVQNVVASEEGKYSLNIETKGLGKPIAHIKSRDLKSKLYEAVFGKRCRMMVIIPEECVNNITFTAVDSGKVTETEAGRNG